MLRVAVLSDVHGNLQALERAAEEISAWAPDEVWFLGDAVVFGPDPGPCVDLLRELNPTHSIEGNTDRYIREQEWEQVLASSDPADRKHAIAFALKYAYENLSEGQREFLLGFGGDIRREILGTSVYLCHGAPHNDERRLAEDEDEESVRAAVGTAGSDLLLCAHSHIPWTPTIGGCQVINQGSVGYPFDGDTRGCWATLEFESDRSPRFEIKRFNFDRDETIRRLAEFGPMADILVRRLREGRA